MKLQAALATYIGDNLDKLNETYNWKINMDGFPDPEYVPVGASKYEQNRNLREHINERIKNKTDKSALFQAWYVLNWGGVKGNKKETLEKYIQSQNSELISLNGKGIASWSKILSVRDPKAYAIYDARVAISLNSIQKYSNVSEPILFPLLISRNNSFVVPTQKLIRQSDFFSEKAPVHFYSMYLEILRASVKEKSQFDIQDAEMVLFSNAGDLSKVWGSKT